MANPNTAEQLDIKAEVLGKPFKCLRAGWLYPDQHTLPPLISDESGIVVITDFGGNTYYANRRHNKFRPSEGEPNTTYESDITPFVDEVRDTHNPSGPPNKSGRLYVHNIGEEFEGFTTEDGRSSSFYDSNGKPIAPGLDDHPELWNSQAETAGMPHRSAKLAVESLWHMVVKMRTNLNKVGLDLDPISAIMSRVGSADYTNHLYVKLMTDLYPDLEKFIIGGIHQHHEVPAAYLAFVSNYLRILAPYITMGMHSAPHGYGEFNPNLVPILGKNELQEHNGNEPISSLRYAARAYASDGGVGRFISIVEPDSLLRDADRQVRDGVVSSAPRVFGNHADVRVRWDSPTEDRDACVGRIEFCGADSPMMRTETLTAYTELTARLIDRLSALASDPERGISILHTKYPNLFGKSTDCAEMLHKTHENSIKLGYGEADIINGYGKRVNARQHFAEIIVFATNDGRNPLSPDTIDTLKRSLMTAEEVLANATPSNKGKNPYEHYILTGHGTPTTAMLLSGEHGGNPLSREDSQARSDAAFGRYALNHLGVANLR